MHRRPIVDQPSRLELGQQPIHLRRAEEEVDLGKRLDQLVPVALHHAADGDDRLAPSLVLHPSRLDDGVERLLLGRVDEAARVDDDHLGLGEVAGILGAVIGELCEIALGVDGVLVAAEGDESDLHAGEQRRQRGVRSGVHGRRSTGSVKIARALYPRGREGAERPLLRESSL